MQVSIPQAVINQSAVQKISVGQIAIGPITIGELQISDFALGMSDGTASLTNFRVTIGLQLNLTWSVTVDLLFDTLHWNGSVNLGHPSITVPFHNVTLPGLSNFSVNVANLALNNLAAQASPVTNLALGGAVVSGIRATNVQLPSAGFQLVGLGLSGLHVDGLSVPAASVASVTIDDVHGDGLPMGQISLGPLSLPSTSVGSVNAGAVDVQTTVDTLEFPADLGIVDFTLDVTPDARAQMDGLAIAGLQASASIGKVTMSNVVLPYELHNLTLSDVGIQTISLPLIGVA